MAGATAPRSWPKWSVACRCGRPGISDERAERYRRIATLISFLCAPTIGYACSRAVDGWSRHQAWAEQMPWARYGLGMAALALGGFVGYIALRGLFRVLAPLFAR
jgi:hypothetical protein